MFEILKKNEFAKAKETKTLLSNKDILYFPLLRREIALLQRMKYRRKYHYLFYIFEYFISCLLDISYSAKTNFINF